jgi:hypothetical protein
MPNDAVSFLSADGDRRFLSKTSRLFHSRKNELLLKIDETLRQYHQQKPVDPTAKAVLLLALNTRINNYIDNHIDRNGAQRHGFRLPIVMQLQDEVMKELSTCRPQPPPLIVKPSASANWDKLRNGIKQVIPQGSVAPGSNLLHTVNGVTKIVTAGPQLRHLAVNEDVNNWQEVLQKEHTRGDKLFGHFEVWRHSPDRLSFTEYLDKLPCSTKDFLTEYQVYHAKDLVARALFEAHIEDGRLHSRMNPTLQKSIIATNGSDDAKKRIRQLASKNKNTQRVDTTNWPCQAFRDFDSKGWACFVMSSYNTIYIGQHQGGQFHHSSFLGGAPILAAGMLKVVDGRILEIHGKNGHYQADIDDMRNFLKHLRNQGIDLSTIKVTPFDGDPVPASSLLANTASKDKPTSSHYSSMTAVKPVKTGLQMKSNQANPIPKTSQPVEKLKPTYV